MGKVGKTFRWLGLAQWVVTVATQAASSRSNYQGIVPPDKQFIDCLPYSTVIESILTRLLNEESSELATMTHLTGISPESAGESPSRLVSTKTHYTNQTRTGSASSSASPLPFEEYYCIFEAEAASNTPDSFPNNGTLVYDFDGLVGSEKEQCLSLQKANYSSWVATATFPAYVDIYSRSTDAWQPIRSPPCCNTYCDLTVSRIQLLYWPTPAPTPHITTLVSDGFTFSSPSAYLVYHNVSAYGGDGPACNRQWPSEIALTKAYDPNDIYSYAKADEAGAKAHMTYADLWDNCTAITTAYNPSDPCAGNANCPSTLYSSFLSSFYLQISHCYPILSIPPGLESVHSEWATCNSAPSGGYLAGVYDPPHALVAGNALAGPTPAQENPPIATSAAPVLAASQPQPAKTAAPDPGSDGSKSVDPAPPNSDPSIPDPPKQTPGNGRSNNDPTTAKVADSGSSVGSGIPFVIPAQAASQNQPAASPLPGQAPQASANPGDWNPANSGQQQQQQQQQKQQAPNPADPGDWHPANSGQQQQQQQQQQQDPNQPTLNPQSPGPGPVLQATEVQGHHIQAAPSPNAILVDGNTIHYGGSTAQVAGSPVALKPNGDLIIGSSTVSAFYTPPPAPALQPQVITAAGQAASILPSNAGIVIAGTTLAPDAPAITIAGKPVSFGAGGLLVGSSTINIPAGGAAPNVDDTAATLLPNGNVAVEGTTITPGSAPVTLDGTPISLGSNGMMVIGSSTISVPSSALPSTVNLGGAQNHALVTQLPAGQGVVVDGTTLALGKTATISGTPVALQTGGLVVGSSTIPYQAFQSVESTSIGLGAFINSAINGGMGPGTTTAANGKTTSAISGNNSSSSVAVSESNLVSSTIASGSSLPSLTGPGGHTQTSTTSPAERSVMLINEVLGAAIAVSLAMLVV